MFLLGGEYMKIIKKRYLTNKEAYELIEKRRKEGNPTYEQNISLEYLKTYREGKSEKVNIKELLDMGIKEEIAISLINLEPKTSDEVRYIFSSFREIVMEDTINQILELFNKGE